MPIITGVVAAQSGVTLLLRLRGRTGQLVTQASLASIAYAVTNLTTGAAAGSGSLAVASVIFDSLQLDARWAKDSAAFPGPDGSAGYNFAAELPAALFAVSAPAVPTPYTIATPQRYQIDVVFTPATGQPWRQIFQITAQGVYG
jgi:hypothetical protein